MDERRDPPGAPEPGVPKQTAEDDDGLSDVQRAGRAYDRHVNSECDKCPDVDRERCHEGERLYRAWTGVMDDAYHQLNGAP